MSHRFLTIAAALLAITSGVHAQPLRLPRETREPPLADEPGTILTASAREPRPLAPTVRTTDAPTPVVLLQVRTPSVMPIGKDIDVRFIVENAGRAPAKNVAIVCPLPSDVQVVKATPPEQKATTGEVFWSIESLAAGARQEIVLTVKPPANTGDFEARARVVLQYEQSAKTRFAKPELTVRKTGPEQALCYDYLTFSMEVTNTSGVELTDVRLTDELPEGLTHRPDEVKDKPYQGTSAAPAIETTEKNRSRTWKIGRLAPNQTRRVEYYVTATSDKAGTLQHKAVAQSGDGAQASAGAKVTLTEPKLEIKADALPRMQANLPARVRVTLANRSPRALANIVVNDEIADDCQVEGITAGGQLFGKRVQWIVPSLPPNEERVLELVVRRTEGGPVRHRLTAVYRGLNRTAAATTEFDSVAVLNWDFRGAPAMIELNGAVTYTVAVQNTGTKPAANVCPVVILPPELQLVKAEPKEHKANGGTVEFDPVTLPPNAKATYLVHAKAVKPSAAVRVQTRLSADVYTLPVVHDVMTAIGGNEPASPPPIGPIPITSPVGGQ
jgi:uncharacterized repeat protein (TIGR01451 family)